MDGEENSRLGEKDSKLAEKILGKKSEKSNGPRRNMRGISSRVKKQPLVGFGWSG